MSIRSCLALVLAAAVLGSNALPTPAQAEPYRILFGGDTSHGENYQVQYAAEGGSNILSANGYDYSLARLRPLLARADYTILNLETPLTGLRVSPLKGKDYYHWTDVNKAPDRLAAFGVDAVSLANNHTLDFGLQGLEDSFDALRNYGITWFGAGGNAAEAAKPLVRAFRVGEREARIAVIGAFERRDSYEKYGFYASAGAGGANPLSPAAIAAQVAELRRVNPGIFIIAFPHWGSNYKWRSPEQQVAGRALIDAGVDMVVGHHGHMLQEIEYYRDKWIVYGLGNFMFNSRGRFDQYPDAVPFGLALELSFDDRRSGVIPSAKLYPILADNKVTNYQPRVASPPEAARAFDAMLGRSRLGGAASLVQRGRDAIGSYVSLDFAKPSSAR